MSTKFLALPMLQDALLHTCQQRKPLIVDAKSSIYTFTEYRTQMNPCQRNAAAKVGCRMVYRFRLQQNHANWLAQTNTNVVKDCQMMLCDAKSVWDGIRML